MSLRLFLPAGIANLPIRFAENVFSKNRAVWFSLFLVFVWLTSRGPGVPEPTEIVLTVLVAIAVFYKLRSSVNSGLFSAFSVFLFIYVIYFGALLLVAPQPEYGLDKVLETVSALFFFMLIASHSKDPEQIRSWENALLFIGLLLASLELLFIIPWYKAWLAISGNIFTLPPVSYRLEGIILSGANFTAAFLGLLLPLVVMRFISADSKRSKRLWISCLILIGVVEFFASSRGGWLAAGVGAAVTLLLYYQTALATLIAKARARPSFVLGRFWVAKLLGLLFVGAFGAFLLILQVQATPGHVGVLSGREAIWANAWQIWSGSFWIGQGPGSFPLMYGQLTGLPPGWLASQAHNLWLQVGAESGVIGVGLVTALALVLGRALLAAWLRNREDRYLRAQLSAYIGIGAAIFLANQSDFYFNNSLYTIYCLFLISIALKHAPPARIQLSKFVSQVCLFLLLLFYLAGSWFSQTGLGEYTKGQIAYWNGDLAHAQEYSCKAANVAPQISLYSFECGSTSASLFALQPAGPGLQSAAQMIAQGLEQDPHWPVYWANLAILEWAQGEEHLAIAHMQRAVENAPRNALFAINLGWMAEQNGDTEKAAAAYQQALTLDHWLIESPYFQNNDFRKSIIEAYSLSQFTEAHLVLAAYQALRVNDLETSHKQLAAAYDRYPRSPQATALRGLVALKENDPNAWVYAQTAAFLDDTNPRILVWASQVARVLGKEAEAASLVQNAFLIWATKTEYDSTQFYYAVYHRSPYGQNFVPGFIRADVIPEMIEAFTWLAEYSLAQGDFALADQVQYWLTLEGDDVIGLSSGDE